MQFRPVNSRKTSDIFFAVRRLNLSVPLGSISGFLGQNGEGKSTTLNLNDFDIFDTMCGEDMLNKHTFLLDRPIPWTRLGVTLTVILGLVGLSMVLVERRDF